MANSLVPFVERQAGDSLRAVAEYEDETLELLHCRGDLQRTEMTARVESVHHNITWDWNPPADGIICDLGEKRATLQIHEEAIIIHLLEEPNQGYLIGLEPDAARDLLSFLEECLSHLD